MESKELQRKRNDLLTKLSETANRIRRYSLDPLLRLEKEADGQASIGDPTDAKLGKYLRQKADEAWGEWMTLRDHFLALPPSQTLDDLARIEKEWLDLDRKVDLIQRELIGENSMRAGVITVAWLVGALILLMLLYAVSHGMRGWDFTTLQPWPEWGPWKYGEVAFWSSFGILCYLLFVSTRYIARRDFDRWYQLWYVSTFLRAPFLTVILMMIVLEFVEWYGEGKWIENYILEEGNKTYFIAFVSFSLGLSSGATSSMMRDLSEGVANFVSKVVSRVSQRLSSAVADKITPN